MTEMLETWINDRWLLKLPKHRHDRPEWPWWEAGRLASMYHHLQGGFRGIVGEAQYIGTETPPIFHGVEREVVYDIGSEEGDFPALFSSWGCDVVLFEPNDRVWPNIKAIWEANDLRPPLGTWCGFAGSKNRHYDLDYVDGAWPKCADGPVIGDHGFLNLSERPDVEVITIDTMAALVKPPTAITIDVEGAEWLVIVGANHVMREHRPKIWVSVHPLFARDMYRDNDVMTSILYVMQERGYDRGTFIAHDHETHMLWLPVEHPDAVLW